MAAMALCLFAGQASAQLFPNAPWNRGSKAAQFSGDGACPGGVCPTRVGSGVLRVDAMQDARPGHWSYPGTIDSHLEATHGVSTQGLSRQEKLNLHDSIHEGVPHPIPPMQPTYSTSSYAPRGGGSNGSYAVKSGGSSGGSSFYVGGRDRDGAFISSIGSSISPTIAAPATQPVAQGITQLAIGDRIGFRRSLLAAARKAREAGDITPGQFFLLSAASRNPGTLDKMQAAVHEAAIEEGLATAQAIDWDQLIGFIEKLIPIIIQLIDLFSYSQVHPSHSFEATGFDPYTLAA